MDLKNYIATIPDYPEKGIEFRDISPLMADGNAYSYAVREIVQYAQDKQIDMTAIVDEVSQDAKTIVFVDELHTKIGRASCRERV